MATLAELHLQNHKLVETSNVLAYLIKERSMCDTDTACSLLYAFLDSISNHLAQVDSLYQGLLTDKETSINNTAQKFMSGEQELKRIINQYTNKWCSKGRQEIRIANHELFKKDTCDLFDIIQARVQDETEHLYPLVREMGTTTRSAA